MAKITKTKWVTLSYREECVAILDELAAMLQVEQHRVARPSRSDTIYTATLEALERRRKEAVNGTDNSNPT